MSAPERPARAAAPDRAETDLGVGAAVTDRGLVHHRNEDAVHLDRVDEQGLVAVVCDGVSLSQAADQAARAGASAAGRRLVEGLRRGDRPIADLAADALDAAQRAVSDVARSPGSSLDPPSCTLVLGVCAGGEVAVAWVGDSRAYWVGVDGVTQLTSDNSWASQQVDAGVMSEREAGAHPRGQQITAWLGVDAPGMTPQILTFRPSGPGRLVLCSDGLWGQVDLPRHLQRLLGAGAGEVDLLASARHLVDLALTAGGRDNITVAILDAPAAGPPDATHRRRHRDDRPAAEPTMSASTATPVWELKIRADRDYFDTWKHGGYTFPRYPRDRTFPLELAEVTFGRRDPGRGVDPDVDLECPQRRPARLAAPRHPAASA